MLAGRSTLSPVITIISVESWSPHGSGGDRKLLSGSIAVRCSVTYPTGYSATALKFAQDLDTGHCTWLTTMFINANIWNATFHGGSVPRMASPPPPPPAYVPPDALPGTPSLPTDVQVQDVPPGIRNKPHHLTSGLAHPATSVNASLRSACNKDCCAIDSILARSVAALFKQATKGCTLLTDCAQKAVVAYFVQQALQNTTNAFLAFASNQSREFPSYQDFAARQQLYASTLQQVESANAGLKDFFLTVNEFADQTEAERNVVNGVRGMRKVGGRAGGWAGGRVGGQGRQSLLAVDEQLGALSGA